MLGVVAEAGADDERAPPAAVEDRAEAHSTSRGDGPRDPTARRPRRARRRRTAARTSPSPRRRRSRAGRRGGRAARSREHGAVEERRHRARSAPAEVDHVDRVRAGSGRAPAPRCRSRTRAARSRAIGRKRRGRLIGPVGRNAAIASGPRNQREVRRHRERRVLGEHRDDRVDVVALPRVDVALDELADARRRRARAASSAGCARAACSSIVLRARWSALLIDATVVSSVSATPSPRSRAPRA